MTSKYYIKALIDSYNFTELYKLTENDIYYDNIDEMDKAIRSSGILAHDTKIITKESNRVKLICYYVECMIWHCQGLFDYFAQELYFLSINFAPRIIKLIRMYSSNGPSIIRYLFGSMDVLAIKING